MMIEENNETEMMEHVRSLDWSVDSVSDAISKDIVSKVVAMGKHTLNHNANFIAWYFSKKSTILDEKSKQMIFANLTQAMLEDPYCFMRIMLYIANIRSTDREEIFYKIIVHYLGTMFPEIMLANIELLTKLGKKDDVLYFLQCPNITARVMTWIKHKAKMDTDFAKLMEGTLIGNPIKRVARYRPKLSKNNKWDVFIYKILDDAAFNGITL